MTAKVNYSVIQGSTFNEVLRWETPEKVYIPITNITKSAPVVITAAGHGLVSNWRVKFTNVGGMREINNDSEYRTCTVIDSNEININSINSLSYTAFTSGGVIEYNKPMDLAGMTARMQIRTKVDSDIIIHELTTENGGITLDNVKKEIRLRIQAGITAGFTFSQAVFNLEIVDSLGNVLSFARGSLSLVKEVTR